jgi:N-acetylmuramoyl-L-alanine amidase
MKKIEIISPNYTNRARNKAQIKFVIIHYTGMQSEIESIKRLEDPKSNVSCHYLINRRGKIIQMVKDKNIAWHAGKSKWKRYINLNKCSLGIELVNKGHQYGYQNYSKIQINSLIKLCKYLKKKYSIKKENFLGHSDIAPLRKIDPGEKFPWKKLSLNNLGRWYKKDESNYEANAKNIKSLFFKNLKKLGYRYFHINKRHPKDKLIIKCFQQHYLPKQITGKVDQKTLKISHFLTN